MGNAQQAWEWIGSNLWQIIVIVSLFIQVAPIKINPWSALFKWIGKSIVGDLPKQIAALNKEIQENEKDRIRWEILNFANSCRNGRKHTKDEYVHIITLNKKYKKILHDTNDENGVFKIEYKYIEELYAERLKKDDFL